VPVQKQAKPMAAAGSLFGEKLISALTEEK
jgi:hypothetical protein